MKKNIIIFIGEWKSEIAFFQEFIKNKYNIEWENIKTDILYEINNNFIVFAHPILGNDKHDWWDKKFKHPLTYIAINKRIESCLYSFNKSNEYSYVYLYLTDKDKTGSESKIDWVDDLILEFCNKYDWKVGIIWSIKEIETWFLSGIWKEFIEHYPDVNIEELDNFYKKDIEKENDTKELLTEGAILIDTALFWTSQENIWREFWKYIDIEQAKRKSPSFKKFIETINELLK